MLIPIYKPALNGNEKKYVNQCLDTSWISSKGGFVEKFESNFSNYIGVKYSASVCNGTAALHVALLALGVGPGDEVIVPTLTYIASVNAIAYTGAKPVFVDSYEDTWQMNVEEVSKKITRNTKAIMVVHLYGHPCDMDKLSKLAKDNHLYIIEDCAEALGTLYKSHHIGTIGDIAAFSFYGNKTITTGEGGMVTSNNNDLINRVNQFKGQGLSGNKEYWHDVIGYNYRMTNICAAIGLAQLEQIEYFLERKINLFKSYKTGLNGLPLKLHDAVGDIRHSYWMCSIIVDDDKKRDLLRAFLADHGIETRPVFYPIHMMPMYNDEGGHYKVAESLSKRGINLPSWPELNPIEIDYIVEKIKLFFKN